MLKKRRDFERNDIYNRIGRAAKCIQSGIMDGEYEGDGRDQSGAKRNASEVPTT